MTLGDDVARSYNEIQGDLVDLDDDREPDLCPACGGQGWYVGHDDECYDTGDCVCSGERVRCECADE